jgi:hypothetical protein
MIAELGRGALRRKRSQLVTALEGVVDRASACCWRVI